MFTQAHYQNQDNIFRQDAFLQGMCRRYINKELYLLISCHLETLGEVIPKTLAEISSLADKNPPKLQRQDIFGQRIDKLVCSPYWQQIKIFAHQQRLIATGYDKKLENYKRVSQAALQILFSAYSSNLSCPIAMTDGAIKVLQNFAPAEIKENLLNHLMGKSEKPVFCGQWMTEKIGGSDLRNLETQATLTRKADDAEHYRLFGMKWFCSAIDNEYALVLAQIADFGPSLFLVKVWQDGKLCEGIKLERLKNKLGTRALPTAEVRLEGVLGTLIGNKGQGIIAISPMLNIARFYNSLAATSIMNRAFLAALNYARLRKSFGQKLIDHPLHFKTISELEAKRAASTAMCFELGRLMDLSGRPDANKEDLAMVGALTAIAKMLLAKWSILFVSEAMEAMGGIGYLEDSEFPQLLRDAQVLTIWEGCSNIMALELLRTQKKNNALVLLLKNLCERANALMIDESDACRILRNRLSQISEKIISAIEKSEDSELIYLLPQAKKAAYLVGTCAAALYLAEAKPFITAQDQFSSSRFTTFVENMLCGHFSF